MKLNSMIENENPIIESHDYGIINNEQDDNNIQHIQQIGPIPFDINIKFLSKFKLANTKLRLLPLWDSTKTKVHRYNVKTRTELDSSPVHKQQIISTCCQMTYQKFSVLQLT